MKKTTGIILALGAASLASAPASYAQTSGLCSTGVISQIVYYQFGSTQETDVQQQIRDIKNIVDSCDVTSIRLTGHTDTVGSSALNQSLSVRRANRLRSELAQMGVANGLISTDGRGETELFVPTADNVKEQLNRRVEVLITMNPEIQEVQEYVEYVEPVQEYVEPVQEYVEYVEPVQEYIEPVREYVAPVEQYIEPVVEAAPAPQPAPMVKTTTNAGAGWGGSSSAVIIGGLAVAAVAGLVIFDDDDDDDLPTSP